MIVFILVVPILGDQFVAFSQRLPGYAVRLQALAVEEGNALIAKYRGPWLDALGLTDNYRALKFRSRLAISSRKARNGSSAP